MPINLGPSKFCNGNNVCINAKNPVSSHKSSRIENKYVCDWASTYLSDTAKWGRLQENNWMFCEMHMKQ